MSADAHDIPELDRKGLRRFALTIGSIIAVFFGLAFPWRLGLGYPVWPWVVGGMLAMWGLTAPTSLRPVYRGWMRFGLLLNRVVTPLVLGVLFFLLITPTAVLMKLLRRDPMARGFNPQVRSYRVPSRQQPRDKMEKPF